MRVVENSHRASGRFLAALKSGRTSAPRCPQALQSNCATAAGTNGATGKAQEVLRLLSLAVPKGQQAAGMFVSVILTLAIRATVPRRRRPH